MIGLVSAWLNGQNESTVRFLTPLIEDYFYKGKAVYFQWHSLLIISSLQYHIMSCVLSFI